MYYNLGQAHNFFFSKMSQRRKLGARPYKSYTDENLQADLRLIHNGDMSLRETGAMYNISKSTLCWKHNKKKYEKSRQAICFDRC